MPREFRSRFKIGKPVEGEATPEEAAHVQELVAECEKEYGVQVNFRWDRDPMELVRKAAALMGVSTSAYMKMVLYRQALADVSQAQQQPTFGYNEWIEPPDSATGKVAEQPSKRKKR